MTNSDRPNGTRSSTTDEAATSTGIQSAPRARTRPGRDAVGREATQARCGPIGGIVKMIEGGRDCQDIVIQLSAVSKAVDRAGFAVIALGLRQCIADPTSEQVDVDAMEKLFLSLA